MMGSTLDRDRGKQAEGFNVEGASASAGSESQDRFKFGFGGKERGSDSEAWSGQERGSDVKPSGVADISRGGIGFESRGGSGLEGMKMFQSSALGWWLAIKDDHLQLCEEKPDSKAGQFHIEKGEGEEVFLKAFNGKYLMFGNDGNLSLCFDRKFECKFFIEARGGKFLIRNNVGLCLCVDKGTRRLRSCAESSLEGEDEDVCLFEAL